MDAAFQVLQGIKEYLKKIPFSYSDISEELKQELESFPSTQLVEQD